MPRAYTKDQIVEQPTIGLFAEFGWQTVWHFVPHLTMKGNQC